jgi:hypothetical protein
MGRSHERHELAPVYEFVKLFWIRLLWMTSDIYVDFLLYVWICVIYIYIYIYVICMLRYVWKNRKK